MSNIIMDRIMAILDSSAPASPARNVGQETLVRSAPAGVFLGGGTHFTQLTGCSPVTPGYEEHDHRNEWSVDPEVRHTQPLCA